MTLDYAIIPVREFSESKSRLKDTLTIEQRIALTSSLVRRVTSAITLSRITEAVVVASNPHQVIDLVDGFQKIKVISESTHHGGVNNAIKTGIEFAKRQKASTVTLLPSDLPFINHQKINTVLDLLQRNDLLINGSRKKDGTNLLSMRASLEFMFHFDDNSFVKHTQEATRRTSSFLMVDFEEFSRDLDNSEDLMEAMKLYSANSFGNFLKNVAESRI